MLGNFSFGDYFKEKAIPYAWEFVTETLGLDPDRLWVTVHISDDDAAAIWHDVVGLSAERVQRLDEENFWRMADTGPCGPCSEIFWDKGPAYGAEGGPAHGGAERFVEIWNLVFMQFEQLADGSQVPLPKQSIDTGAGLERILSVLQDVDSVWDTGEFQHLLGVASRLAGAPYGSDPRSDVSMRILADHARSTAFLINDGVFPSNNDRGYVLRRIMRRAIRHAYIVEIEQLVLPEMIDAVVGLMGADYPELAKNHDFIREVAQREEERFRQTLKTGSAILDVELDKLAAAGETMLPGDVAFLLHDTYGFPLEVTQEIVAERNLTVDNDAFGRAMQQQRKRAQDARKVEGGTVDVEPYLDVLATFGPTEFVGRDHYEIEARVLHVDDTSIVLDRTPFYAESGGQVGDTGTIGGPAGSVRVIDTQAIAGALTRHIVAPVEGRIETGQSVVAAIDGERRDAIRRHHTGTHVLHWALRTILGEHVKQQGSWVGPDHLRFDFSHYQSRDLHQRARAPLRDHERPRRATGRDCVLRRQVRRHRARARSRRTIDRALWRHACARVGRYRADEDRVRGIDRFQYSSHRSHCRLRAHRASTRRGSNIGVRGRARRRAVGRARVRYRKAARGKQGAGGRTAAVTPSAGHRRRGRTCGAGRRWCRRGPP
ncbi:MAG: alanine--tRNA ligase [Actinobacteria bacterium]|nr:MAG: alanine--tRNA ligase [Actinomycetota bacterium]